MNSEIATRNESEAFKTWSNSKSISHIYKSMIIPKSSDNRKKYTDSKPR